MHSDDVTIHDDLFGELRVHIAESGSLIMVTGPRIPDASLRRALDATVVKGIPIGTRDASALTMTIDGVGCDLRPGRGGLTRPSHKVDVTVRATDYRLKPSSQYSSTLLADNHDAGEFVRDSEDRICAVWQDAATPEHAAVGYLLAMSFGIGARSTVDLLIDGIAQPDGVVD
jgi:hypothetical protein